MTLLNPFSRIAAVSCLSAMLTLNVAFAQPAEKPFEPSVGQEGKDVIWVPTPQALVDKMLDMAKVTAKDNLVDLGSGDGRTVITAAKRGVTARGIEYNPDMVALSRANAAKEGVGDKATFEQADIFVTDFSKADVVTMFLLTSLNAKLRPTILDMKPGTRVVSNTFDMGEWKADEEAVVTQGCTSYCKAYFWIVPAKVDGSWAMDKGELEIKQTFQNFTGTIKNGNVITPVTNGKLKGDEITFTAGGTDYAGKVNGATIEGTTKSGAKWQAKRGA
ncbi:SAM-dependent methyltransferase [Pseudorhodoplanes sinuspersici]|uniref:SAM-dependent methyltransferase n=1 Tax=Pseudorhodoplanes sinuspersici TaxID=1235591 RepID=A0A1W6ZMG7_9HYPH|nr:class I SAM-dependent methyltransferase [Pseudorhodoplanes sinuspersici]ARP98320.1 SAM-dependent methyltransferase [Pseudorhodoplanes sinuspersici]RKE65976.1 methyltransferase family protein [Pseudorhodoplanes sinuspersici]